MYVDHQHKQYNHSLMVDLLLFSTLTLSALTSGDGAFSAIGESEGFFR